MRIEFRTINPNVKIEWGDEGDHTYAALETGGEFWLWIHSYQAVSRLYSL